MAEIPSNTNAPGASDNTQAASADTSDAPSPGGPSCSASMCLPMMQGWTAREGKLRGYPIVDDKYCDLTTGKVVAVGAHDWVVRGPPNLDVYWQNRRCSGDEDEFRAVVITSSLSMTEYVIRVGALIRETGCDLQSLTATTYSINVIVFADKSKDEMLALLSKHGLW